MTMTEEVPVIYGKKVKKERPTGELLFDLDWHKLMLVSHMMKLFGQEYKRESGGMRKSSLYEIGSKLTSSRTCYCSPQTTRTSRCPFDSCSTSIDHSERTPTKVRIQPPRL